jgi:3-hydroxypropanoate dehydrogenase
MTDKSTGPNRPQASPECLDLIFREAHTHTMWLPEPISDDLLNEVYNLAKLGPTSANSGPMRIVFVKSDAAKARLIPALSPNNVEKSRTAAAVAIFAYDLEFYEQMPKLYPQADARSWFVGKPDLIQETAFRNATLQAAYFMLAARAMGLDCGPMSGFDQAKVNAEFFPDGKWKSNFVCNLGYGDPAEVRERNPRLAFDDACTIL